ncbi:MULTISPECIES: hypothetical protein [unclassified Lactococcus]|uniref:hypothetical protein n=1 Tax=unclassified Lactococcus TaxID=2643510 RepID=UPI0011C94913|nr:MULTISPECIES: hypothetical protein [unclassified Lactococcus]MQW23502.1 hypothetical protein [Lactococcus sp. dk101]TXK37833.1 hypothetical protein FVP42_07470 [Lactococcus sp. dk310]TXK49310.1 hypothetical protein FVP43_07455 [Lactococcus sp. dk322]
MYSIIISTSSILDEMKEENIMTIKSILVASTLSIGLLAGGATLVANAATPTATTQAATSAAATSSTSATSNAANSSTNAAPQGNGQGQPSGAMQDRGANPNDTTITGANADKATAAVVAKYAGFKVDLVQQDKDGSYDVHGTLNGSKVMYNVTTGFVVE